MRGPASGERPMSAVNVARCYLRCELPNIVPASGNADAVDMVEAGLAALGHRIRISGGAHQPHQHPGDNMHPIGLVGQHQLHTS